MYKYATFNLGRDADNSKFQGRDNLYGIEVTIPALARLCKLGNLDPQHTDGNSSLAACVAAITCPMFGQGATLITVRPDADSVAAMAVLSLRSEGYLTAEHPNYAEIINRIQKIGDGDCAPDGEWVRNYIPPEEFAIASKIACDHRKGLDERVALMATWLLGIIKIAAPAPSEHGMTVELIHGGKVALVRANGVEGRGANQLGYQHAPIVIVVNPTFTMDPSKTAPHLKFGIARFNEAIPMRWAEMLQELKAIEPGWGGTTSICGSTQNQPATVTLEQVINAVGRAICAPSAQSVTGWTEVGHANKTGVPEIDSLLGRGDLQDAEDNNYVPKETWFQEIGVDTIYSSGIEQFLVGTILLRSGAVLERRGWMNVWGCTKLPD